MATAGKKTTVKKKAVTVTLNATQRELLRKIAGARAAGYLGTKAEVKSIQSLQTKKLAKRGTRDKTSGIYRTVITPAGAKLIGATAPGSMSSTPSPASPVGRGS
jgi:hypothetical protein